MLDNLFDIYGEKFCKTVEKTNCTVEESGFSLSGYVSKLELGCGRASSDRKFLYINTRPVDLPKVCKIIHELYRSNGRKDYPSYILNIQIPTSEISFYFVRLRI